MHPQPISYELSRQILEDIANTLADYSVIRNYPPDAVNMKDDYWISMGDKPVCPKFHNIHLIFVTMEVNTQPANYIDIADCLFTDDYTCELLLRAHDSPFGDDYFRGTFLYSEGIWRETAISDDVVKMYLAFH